MNSETLTFNPDQVYSVVARRSNGWWALHVPELPGVHSQVRRLAQAEAMIRDAIGLALDISPSDVRVGIPSLTVNPELDRLLTLTRSQREDLAVLRISVDELTRRLAHEMADEGISVRDIAQSLDVSFQYAAKLAKSSG